MNQLLLFVLAMVAYYAFHSFLASKTIKKLLIGKIIPLRIYRLFFNGVAIGLIYPLYLLFEKVDKTPYFETSIMSQVSGWVLIAFGAIIATLALANYQISEFVGTHQLQHNEQPFGGTLKTNGLNAYTRHPLYFGVLLLVWGIFLVFPLKAFLAIATVTTLYAVIGSLLEEKKLIEEFGDVYIEYKKKVPMLLPIKF